MSILSTLSDRKAQSFPPHSWHDSCNICISRFAPWWTNSWSLPSKVPGEIQLWQILIFIHPGEFDYVLIFTKLLSLLLSPHTAAVGCWEPPDGLPVCSGVHERHCLKPCRPAARMSAYIPAQDAAVLSQNFKRHVIVPPRTHARPHTVLKEHNFVWIIA